MRQRFPVEERDSTQEITTHLAEGRDPPVVVNPGPAVILVKNYASFTAQTGSTAKDQVFPANISQIHEMNRSPPHRMSAIPWPARVSFLPRKDFNGRVDLGCVLRLVPNV